MRSRFATPKKCLLALGFKEDEIADILSDARVEALKLANDSTRGARDDQRWSYDPAVEQGERLDQRSRAAGDGEQMDGGKVERILRMLKESGVDDRVRQKVMYMLQADEGMPGIDDIEKFLTDRGLTSDEIDETFRLAGVDRRRSGKDTLPRNGLSEAGAMNRGGGMGGRMSERPMAGDAAIQARLARKYPGIERVAEDLNFGLQRRPHDRRPAPTPSREQAERLHARFPHMRDIVVGG